MDDMAQYYAPPPQPPPAAAHHNHHPQFIYYQPPPPGASQPPPLAVAQPHYHQPHHQSPYGAYALTPYTQSSYDEVRTLFVAGLPEDVKPREIYNLFREFPGYESSHLRNPSHNTQPFGFAVFVDQQSAVAALQALNGMVFDLEKGSTLYVDLAKSNSRSKRSRIDNGSPGSEKRIKESVPFRMGTFEPGVGSVHMPGMSSSAYGTIGYPPTQSSYGNFAGRPADGSSAAKLNNSSAPYVPSNNPACPTLFVANLGQTCSEEELIQVFSRCRGYLKLKMQSTYGAPVAFVDFKDTAGSTEALGQLQGTVLYSSPPGEGMRLEYAKARMGTRSRKSR